MRFLLASILTTGFLWTNPATISLLAQNNSPQNARVVALDAILTEFASTLERITNLEIAFQRNAANFQTLGKEMEKISSEAFLTQVARTANQIEQQALEAQGGGTILRRFGNTIAMNDNAALQLKDLQASLELQQLSATQAAFARKQIECSQEAIQLSSERRAVIESLTKFQDRLWDYADPANVYSEAENRMVLEKLSELDELNFAGYLIRGLLHQRLNQKDEAIADLNYVLDQNGWNSPLAMIARGRIYSRMNKLSESQSDLKVARKLTADDAYAQWLLGSMYAADRDWSSAAIYWRKVLVSSKFEVAANRSMALINYELNKDRRSSMKEALQQAEIASGLTSGTDWLAELTYGIVLHAADQQADAKKHLDAAVELAEAENKVFCEQAIKSIERGEQIDTSFVWN